MNHQKNQIIKISCKAEQCEGYYFFEIKEHFDGKCNICDKNQIIIEEPNITEILSFAELELESANHHGLTDLPAKLYKKITDNIILADNEQKILANLIAITFYHSI